MSDSGFLLQMIKGRPNAFKETLRLRNRLNLK